MPIFNNKWPFRGAGNQRLISHRTLTPYNIDNGAGTTIDEVLTSGFPFDSYLVDVRASYTEATDTTGAASANFKLGITAGGATLVAATALEAAKAIGSYTLGTPLAVLIPANTPVFVRHTGVATTEVGQYHVEALFLPKP
jgi:poly(3-hydroxyalkanoate) synthetase